MIVSAEFSGKARLQDESSFKLYAYFLMSNHFHLLIEVDQCPASSIMQCLLTGYTQYFNIRNERVGHLFQGRFKAELCQRDSYFIGLIRYIHRNPVRACMVDHPGAWPWSGHHDYLRRRPTLTDTAYPLTFFGAEGGQARRTYEEFVAEEGAEIPMPQSTQGVSVDRPVSRADEDQGLVRKSLEAAAETGFSLESLRGRSRLRPILRARERFVLRLLERGCTAAQLGRLLARSSSTMSRLAEAAARSGKSGGSDPRVLV